MTFLDGFLYSHSEHPALIDGVRVPVVKSAVSFFFNYMRPKHRMPFRQLASPFLYKEFKEIISFGHIKVICALGLFDPSLIYC
jgi:hypothetical protein